MPMIDFLWERVPVEWRWLKVFATLLFIGVLLILASAGRHNALLIVGAAALSAALLLAGVSFVGKHIRDWRRR